MLETLIKLEKSLLQTSARDYCKAKDFNKAREKTLTKLELETLIML